MVQMWQLKVRAPKRFYMSLVVFVLGFVLSSTSNLIGSFLKDFALGSSFLNLIELSNTNLIESLLKSLPGGSSVAEKFHLRVWDLLLFVPFLMLWKNATLIRGTILWVGLFNFIFLHLFYTTNQVVIIPALLLGWGLGFVYMGIALLRGTYKHFKDSTYRKYFLLSLSSWVLLALCYPPLPLGYLVFVVLVPWMWAMSKVTRTQAITISFWSGFVHNAIMYYWIKNVIAVGPGAVVAIGLAMLLSWFALFSIMSALFFRRSISWGKNGVGGFIIFPLLFVGIEVVRTFGDISFPWAHIAYTLGDIEEMIQVSAWIGVFGMSVLIALTNYFVFWVLNKNSHLMNNKSAKIKVGLTAMSLPVVLVVALYVFGWNVLDNATLSNDTAKVVLVQPSILQSQKWDRKYYIAHMNKTYDLVEDERHHDADLIVLPETAIPNYKRFARRELNKLRQLVQRYQAPLFTGILDFDKKGPPGRVYNFYNTGITLRPDKSEDSYSKIRLVPFSEKLPWDDLFPVLNYVNLGEGDFRPGTETPVYDEIKWTPNICYETIYPSFVRGNIRSGARLIINITNDGWFGRSTAPYQHLNLVKFRAVENGIPIARVANTGISAFVDEYGRIRQQTNLFETLSIVDEIPLKSRDTLYSRIGDTVEDILFYIGLLLFVVILFQNIWLRKK